MSDFFFQNPHLLWLLCAIPLLALIRGKRGRAAAIAFPSIGLARTASRQARSGTGGVVFYLRLLALTLLIIALARPQLGQGYSEIESSGVDIMLAVDISGSMFALDFSEQQQALTRLDVVKEVVADFIDQRPSDRIGLLAFSRHAYAVSPLTTDHGWLQQNLQRLRIGMIDSTATAIGPAISNSTYPLKDLAADSRIIILLTDGEDNVHEVPPLAAAEAAAAYGIKIYTIAVGKQGRVPFPRVTQDGELVRNRSGQIIIEGYMENPIDDGTLRSIADVTDGRFYHAHDRKQLEQIYQEIDRLEKTEIKLRHFADRRELFHWLLIAVLVLLGIEQLLNNTLYRKLP